MYLAPLNKSSAKKKWRIRLFIGVMIAYPLVHFSVFWLYVNFNSIALAFQDVDIWTQQTFFSTANFEAVFRSIMRDAPIQNTIINSLLFFPVTCLITIPLSMLFSYFLFKKMPMSNAFRVIFFLPSIMPVATLTFAFSMPFNRHFGFIFNESINWFGASPYSQIIVFAYCIWAGLGFNIVLMSGAMGRVPQEVVESAQLDGITMRKEFTHIMIPLIWPTIVTSFILAMTSVLTVFLQPLLLTEGHPNGASSTISLAIFEAVSGRGDLGFAAAFGLSMSLIFAPIIMITRHFLSKIWSGVEF